MTDEAAYLERVRATQRRNWPASVPRTPFHPFGEIPLAEQLRTWAQRQPDKDAVIYYGRAVSYAELDRLSDRFAAALAGRGIGQGDHVAVCLQNCPQFLVAFYGLLKLGAVHVPVNPMFKAIELEYELVDSQAIALVALDQLYPLARGVLPRTGIRHVFTTSLRDMLPEKPTLPLPPVLTEAKRDCPGAIDLMTVLDQTAGAPPRVEVDLDAPAALNYTGGTTGMAKGCVHTQRDMLYTAATALPMVIGLTTDDVTLCFMPLFWIAGEDMGIIFPIYAGATLVLLTRWDPLAYLKAVQTYRVSHTYVLVDNAIEVMEQPDLDQFDLRSIRKSCCTSFVKKLNPEVRKRWRALTGSVIHEVSWGMTETHTFDTFTTGMQDDDFDLRQQPSFVGLPVPGTDFKICDFETADLLALGEPGEICVRTPSLLKAYWNKPEVSATALRDGWLHTGDIGILDEGGYLHFLGRRKEMLKVRGMSVFPGEVEMLLAQHPAVLGAAIVGRPDAERGEVPVAFVMLKDTDRSRVGAQEIVTWCRENMAGYKVPEVRLLERLPLTATGKVAKEELKLLLADAGTRGISCT
jgi:acyl-CoA synthetase (AMP-forming)/AMP-acid ligase II